MATKLRIPATDAEGRIVAELLRNSDKDTASSTGGVHDYDLRGILGCQNLNCKGSSNDLNYANHEYNSQLVAPNQTAYNAGSNQLGTGKTYNQLVTANIQNDPVGATLAGAGMVGLGYLTGGTGTAVGMKLFGATVGTVANAAFQYFGNDPFSFFDLGIAGGTGFLTTGMGLRASIVTNVGGAVIGSSLQGQNPNAGISAAALGTIAGYGVGAGSTATVRSLVDPQHWYRPQWIDIGLGMSRPNTPSAVPGMVS